MFKILLVDDDVHALEALSVGLHLQWEDLTILTARDGRVALRLFFEADPDLVVLDASLHDEPAFDVLRQIRQVSDAPVVILSGTDDDTEHVRALELGADDYVVKPFNQLVLLARIRAILRRAELPPPASAQPDFEAGDLTICFGSRRVTVGGHEVRLTPVEFRLLYHLVRNAGRLLPHDALLDRLWNGAAEHTADHLKVYVSRLRSKIERPGGPRYIENERGLGYRFVRPPARQAAGHAAGQHGTSRQPTGHQPISAPGPRRLVDTSPADTRPADTRPVEASPAGAALPPFSPSPDASAAGTAEPVLAGPAQR